MATNQSVTSFSLPRQLQRRFAAKLPRHGDRSKLLSRMIEMWLNGEIQVTGVSLRSLSVAAPNIIAQWQQP
jgi:hypothetical protein